MTIKPILFPLLAIVISVGCSKWNRRPAEISRLPAVRMASDSVGLKLAVAEIPVEDFEKLEEFWAWLDAQSIPLDVRREWDRNGMRGAIAPPHLPAVFHELFGETRIEGVEHTADAGKHNLLTHKVKWNRSNEVEMILVSKPYERLHWTVQRSDGRQRTGANAQANCCFFLRSIPKGDGSVEVRIRPGIRFGQPKAKFKVRGDDFLYQSDQEEIEFDELELATRMRLGETLVIGSTYQSEGLGNAFFQNDQSESKTQRILLVRIIRTQLDDLFAPERIQTPIATPKN